MDVLSGAGQATTIVVPARPGRARTLAASPLPCQVTVWSPRTIGPVPEEMELEDALRRRLSARPAGFTFVPPSKAASPAGPALQGRCAGCDARVRWGTEACATCLQAANESDDDPGDLEPVGGRRVDWTALVVLFVIVAGALAWGWLGQDRAEARHAQVPCTQSVADDAFEGDC